MNKDDLINSIIKIRKKTGLGFMECKKILIESNFNISLSIKKSLDIKKNKFNKINLSKTTKGKVLSGNSEDYKYSILLEINSETDFLSKNIEFNNFCNNIIKYSIENRIIDFNIIKEKFNLYKLNLISKFNENISFGKKYIFYKNDFNYSYVHINKIGVIINITNNFNINILKEISMQIISNKPEYIDENSIPKNLINNEYDIQNNIFNSIKKNDNYKKYEFLNEKIKEFIENKSLLNQKSIFDEKYYIKEILNKYNINILEFKIIELIY